MKIFVTGGTGFVGRAFLRKAVESGYKITALVREGSRRGLFEHENIVWLKKDLDKVLIDDLLGHELVLHMAAHTANPPYANLSECIFWNVLAPVKLFESAVEAGVTRFINIGSCFEYADGACSESQGLTPDSPLGPSVSYPTSKAAATIALEGFAREKMIELTTLRLFQVYGDGEKLSRLYPSLIKAAKEGEDFPMTSGLQTRDFINVEVVVEKILISFGDSYRPLCGAPKIYHVASGIPLTVLEFVKKEWINCSAKGDIIPGKFADRSGQFQFLYSSPEYII